MIEVTEEHVVKILDLMSHGLCKGLGSPKPGEMCVEAVVCHALGLPHGDDPSCVSKAVRVFKIVINDSAWSSNRARAKGMRQLAIAQLGSNIIDEQVFIQALTLGIINKILPLALRAAAKIHPDKKHQDSLNVAADKCSEASKQEATAAAAEAATAEAEAEATTAAWTMAAWAMAAATAAEAEAEAARAAARTVVTTAAWAMATATAAEAEAEAARAAARAVVRAAEAWAEAWAEEAADKDTVLSLACEIAVDALKEAKSPGCQFLHLCEEK